MNNISIPNGIDLKVFKRTESNLREKYGLGNKQIVLGVAGIWSETNNIINRPDKAFIIALSNHQAAFPH